MTVWGSDAGTRLSLLPMEGGAPKGRRLASQAPPRVLFFVYRSLSPSRMKRREPRAYGVRCFPFSDVLSFLLDRKRKRFLACARNDGMGKRCGDTTLPPSYGRRCPEGAEVGFPSTAEGAFFVYRSLFPSRMKRRDPRVYGVRRFPFSDTLLFLLDRKRKRFLTFARNDTREKVAPHHLSHHHIELCLCEVLYPAPL